MVEMRATQRSCTGLLVAAAVFGMLLTACDTTGTGGGTTNTTARMSIDTKAVYNTVLQAAPVLTNTASGFVPRSRALTTWTNGDRQTLYGWIKDFNPDLSTMAQNLDDSNFYCSLNSTISGLKAGVGTANDAVFSSPTVFTTPLALFTTGFDVAWTGGGHRTSTGSTVGDYYWLANGSGDTSTGDLEGIAMRKTAEGGSVGGSIAYLKKGADGTVKLDQTYFGVDAFGEFGSPRVILAGNITTREFSVRGGMINGKTATNWYGRTVFVARGSAATGGYFILHWERSNGTWDGNTHTETSTSSGEWLKVPGGADDATLDGLTGYATYADLVTAEGDSNGSGVNLVTELPLLGDSDFMWTSTDMASPTGFN